MKHFLYDIAIRHTRWTLSIWTILFLFDVLLTKYVGSTYNFVEPLFGFSLAFFMSTVLMNQTQWPLLWRRTSETIQHFWMGILTILLFNITLNILCFFIFQTLRGNTAISEIFKSTPLDISWIIIIAFTLSLIMLVNQKAMLANNSHKPARHVLLLIGFYAWAFIAVPVFVYSRLLGYTFIETSLIVIFLLSNTFILNSIRQRTRIHALFITIAGTLVWAGLGYKLELTKSPEPSNFLGQIGPKKTWNFSELETIDKPSVWVGWVNGWLSAATDINSEQMNQALIKLEEICPLSPTDYPSVIECSEKNTDAIDTVIYGKADETVILSRLKSSHLFVKLFGVLSARQLEYLSAEIKSQLVEISRSAGRLSLVAEKTLADHKKDNKVGLKIFVRRKNQISDHH